MSQYSPSFKNNLDALKADTTQRGINVKYPTLPLVGAKGDGITDDTAAIQNALASLDSQYGGVVYLPAGVYIVSATLTLPQKTRLIGAGSSATVIKQSGMATSSKIISVPNPYCHISEMSVDGNMLGNGYGIYVDTGANPANFWMNDVTIYNFAKASPWDNSVVYLRGYNFSLHNVETVGGVAGQPAGAGAIYGIKLDSAFDVRMTNIITIHNDIGIALLSSAVQGSNFQLDSNITYGLLIDTCHGVQLSNVRAFYNASAYGAATQAQTGIVIGGSGPYGTTNLNSNIQLNSVVITNIGDGTTNSIGIELKAGELIQINNVSLSDTTNDYFSGGSMGVAIKYNYGSNTLAGSIKNVITKGIGTITSGTAPASGWTSSY